MNLALPFRRIPLWQHLALVTLVLSGVSAASWGTLQHLSASVGARRLELEVAQRQILDLRAQQTTRAATDFSVQLPTAATADEVNRDIARFAESSRVQVQSLAAQVQAPTARDVGRIQYSMSAVADYPALKTWLSALLGRYPTLALSTLSLRAAPNEATRLTASVTLLLYVKD